MTSIKKIPNVLGTRRSNTLDQERDQFEKSQVIKASGDGVGYLRRGGAQLISLIAAQHNTIIKHDVE